MSCSAFPTPTQASLAAARRGPMKHRRSRPTDLSRGAVSSGVLTACRSGPASLAARASCSWSLRCCAEPHTLQPGGQRSHRTKADRGSQQSASVGARPVRLDRRGSAQVAAERRSGRRAPRVSARRRFSQSSREVAGNKYRSAAYLLKLRYRIISNTYGSGTTY